MVRRVQALVVVCAAMLIGGTAQAEACVTQHNSVHVALSISRYPETTDHWMDAIDVGQPSLLHIDRADGDQHRDESLANFPPRSGYDRDEYPPAMSEEGGFGADVRYIDPADNRGSGSVMGNALEDYCEGQPFRIDFTP